MRFARGVASDCVRPPRVSTHPSHRDRVHATTHPASGGTRACVCVPRANSRTSGLTAARHMTAASHGLRRTCVAAQDTPPTALRPPAHSQGSRPLLGRARGDDDNIVAHQQSIAQKLAANLAQHCFAPTGGRRFGYCLTPPCPCPHTAPARLAHASPVPLPAWQVSRETLSVLRAGEPRGRTTWTSRRRPTSGSWGRVRQLLTASCLMLAPFSPGDRERTSPR